MLVNGITILILSLAYQGDRLGLVFLLFLLYGMTALPMVYCLSFAFSSASSAYARLGTDYDFIKRLTQTRLCILFIFGGIAMLITVFVTAIPSTHALAASKVLKIVFFIHPGFAVGQV